jgi:outer membrane protein assembly factor BamB
MILLWFVFLPILHPDLTFGIKTFHFGNDYRYRNIPSSIAIQADGKILIGGGSVMADGGPVLMRLNTNGALDGSFSDDGYLIDAAYVLGHLIPVLSSRTGQILALAGKEGSENKVMRFNTTGL